MGKYTEIISATCCGLDYKIGLIERQVVEGSYSHSAPSDIDYYGYSNYQFDLLDTDGNLDESLQYFVTDDSAIESIEAYYQRENEDNFAIPDID